jgi:hypothetical protein
MSESILLSAQRQMAQSMRSLSRSGVCWKRKTERRWGLGEARPRVGRSGGEARGVWGVEGCDMRVRGWRVAIVSE